MTNQIPIGGVVVFCLAVVGLLFCRFFPKHPDNPKIDKVPRESMQALLSIGLTCAALFIILSRDFSP